MSILFFQYGNYEEAYRRFAEGGPETYRDQRVSVDFVERLSHSQPVATYAICKEPHDTALTASLRSIGMRYEDVTRSAIRRIFDETAPDRLIVRTPHLAVLQEAKRRKITTLPCFADIFSASSPKSLLNNGLLRLALTGDHVSCVANHSANASLSMVKNLYFSADRVVPWDWSRIPARPDSKRAVADAAAPTAFYAGAMNDDKGVGDCFEAIADLKRRGVRLTMKFAGGGDLDHWRERARALGVDDQVTLMGLVPNDSVKSLMADHDFVIVPSRHSFPEGLPNTIYEGLASRSVLLMSDHPAFAGRLADGAQCVIFKAADPVSLADSIARLCGDPALFATISQNAPEALESLYVGLEWTDLVSRFVDDPRGDNGWISENALAAIAP